MSESRDSSSTAAETVQPAHDRAIARFEATLPSCEVVDGGCWLWPGPFAGKGYGVLAFSSGNIYAHRLSLEISSGAPVRSNLVAMHSCDNPPCVNPDHLSWGTHSDNGKDAAKKLRSAAHIVDQMARTSCTLGHPLSSGNLTSRGENGGKRECLACSRGRGVAAHRRRYGLPEIPLQLLADAYFRFGKKSNWPARIRLELS